jgi:hypothetical protein
MPFFGAVFISISGLEADGRHLLGHVFEHTTFGTLRTQVGNSAAYRAWQVI